MKLNCLITFSIICISLFFAINSFSQGNMKITGRALGDYDKTPIPYCSVSLKNSTTGVVADSLGNFILQGFDLTDSIQISHIGYQKQTIFVGDLLKPINIIYLKRSIIKLDEVSINASNLPQKYTYFNLGYYSTKSRGGGPGILGKITAVYISNNSHTTKKIIKLQYSIRSFAKCLVRVQLYTRNVYTGLPEIVIIPEDLRIVVKKHQTKITVDVSKFNILLPAGGVFVTLQHLGEIDRDGKLINKKLNNSPIIISFSKNSPSVTYYSFWGKTFEQSIVKSSVFGLLNDCFGITVAEFQN